MSTENIKTTDGTLTQNPRQSGSATDSQPAKTCSRGHPTAELTLKNTRGDRPGQIFECPDCERLILITSGTLVGGSSQRVIQD